MLGRGILADARIKAVGILVESHRNNVRIGRTLVDARRNKDEEKEDDSKRSARQRL